MTVDEFKQRLEQQFNPNAAAELDFHLLLVCGSEKISCHIYRGELRWSTAAPTDLGARFYFPSIERALVILTGVENPIEAFMKGEFYANGYLVWTFPLLTAFQRELQPG